MIVRRVAGWLAALLVLAVLGVAGPSLPAGAHAQVRSTDPADGVRLAEPPSEVSVTFTEAVSAELGGLRVLDEDGARVDDGDVEQPSRDVLRVGLDGELPEGTYIATFQVVSADGHPIRGAWVFAVGESSSLDIDPASVTPESDTTWERIGDAARTVTYAGTLLAAGGIVFMAFVVDGTIGTRRLRGAIVAGAAVGFAGLLVWTASQAAIASGLGSEAAFDPAVLEVVLRNTMGWTVLVTTAGLVAVVVATRCRRRAVVQTVGFYGAAAVIIGYALWGHASAYENRWLAIGADLLHSAVAAVWFGGLVMLALLLRDRGRLLRDAPADDDGAELAPPPGGAAGVVTAPRAATERSAPSLVTSTGETVARFSQLAAWAVALLWVGGVVLTWLGTGGVDGLLDSSYGRLVLAKAAVVVLVMAVAAWNRRVLVPTIARDAVDAEDDPAAAPDRDAITERWALLRRSVRGEAAALVLVIGLTGVLVNTPPAVDDPTSADGRGGDPFDSLVALEGTDLQLQINVVPAAVGDNDIHLSYYDGTGLPADVAESVQLEFELPERDVAPIEREAPRAGPGHFLWEGDVMSIAGTWTISVTTRVSEFEEVVTEFAVPVAP